MTSLLIAVLTLALGPTPDAASEALPELGPVRPSAPPVTVAECDRWAAPHGSRTGPRGTRRNPFRSVAALALSLRAGETGCVLPGEYRRSDPTKLKKPRTRLVGIGRGVRVDGAIWVMPSAVEAQVRRLDLTASDPQYNIPLKVQADRVLVAENEIRGAANTICVLVGSDSRATGVRIERNWIHDCGRHGKFDHLIYLQSTEGAVVQGNALTGNHGGWAVHMYPNADGSRIERNLIDHNRGGVIFAGNGEDTSDDNLVRANVIERSRPRWNIEGSWGATVGAGNYAEQNCLYSRGPNAPSGIGDLEGFSVGYNLVTRRPAYPGFSRQPQRSGRSSACERLVDPLPRAFPGRSAGR